MKNIINAIKKINKDKDYNNFFIRATGIFMVIACVNIYEKTFDKYGYLIGFFVAIVIGAVVYTLWSLVLGFLYKKFKSFKR